MTNKTTWLIDHINTEIGFTVSHLMIDQVKGTFKSYDAIIHTIGNDFTTAEIDMCIEASSLSTGDAHRDEYIKSPDFLDTKKHPHITFNSRDVQKSTRPGIYVLRGELTIKEITECINLELEFQEITQDITGKERVDLKATGRINRMNWGLNWNTIIAVGGLMIDEEISIECEIKLIKKIDVDVELDLVPQNKPIIPAVLGIFGR